MLRPYLPLRSIGFSPAELRMRCISAESLANVGRQRLRRAYIGSVGIDAEPLQA